MSAATSKAAPSRWLPWVAHTLMVFAATPGALPAQQKPAGGQQYATRAELTERLGTLERQSAAGRTKDRATVQEQIAIVRARLETGDFKPGDRFIMTLRQDSIRSDTLVVRDSLRVAVLNLPEFSVAGVLRAELENRLNAHVSRFLRNAEVRTTLLTRVSVTGAVRTPGFYYAVPDRPINDLLTSAGGPLPEADLRKLSVTRVGRTLLKGGDAKSAIEDGRTLESLDIQSGDTVNLPLKRTFRWEFVFRLAFVVSSLFFAVLRYLQWYYSRETY